MSLKKKKEFSQLNEEFSALDLQGSEKPFLLRKVIPFYCTSESYHPSWFPTLSSLLAFLAVL